MKRVEAIIRPFKLADVRARLQALGVGGMTVNEVTGCGRQRSRTARHRAMEHVVELIPRIQLSVVVAEARVPEAVETILSGARTL